MINHISSKAIKQIKKWKSPEGPRIFKKHKKKKNVKK